MFKLFKYLKPYWWQCLLLVVGIGAQTYLTLQLPALMADIVNYGIVTGDQNYIFETGLKMLGFALASSLFALVAHFFSARVGAAFSRDLRSDFYKQVLSFSISEIDDFSTASLITRTTNDIGQVQQAVMMMLTMMLRAPLMGIGAIFQAFQTAPDLTWTIGLGVGLIIFFAAIILGLTMPKFKIYQKTIDELTLVARENLTGLRVIRAFNNDALERAKFEKPNKKLTKLAIFIDKIFAFQDPLIEIVFNGITLLVVWLSLTRLETDITYLGDMLAFVQYATQIFTSFLILTMLFFILPRANVSAGRINEVMTVKPRIRWKEATVGTPEKTPSVEFKNVSFAYLGAEQDVLTNISFRANAGETTAFIGSTGSGKSTLVSLIPRFYEATKGEVLVDGINVKDYSAKDLMKRIGYVPQKGILFSGSVKSNINFGVEDEKSTATKKSARIA